MRYVLALTVILLAIRSAPHARAADAAEDAPPPIPADQTTPRGTLKLFALAVQAAEGDKVRQCLHTASDTESRYAQRYADVTVSLGRFRAAMLAQYGEKAAPTLKTLAPIREGHHIDAAAETITGAEAVVEIKGDQAETIAMIKVDGKWKIAISKMIARRSASDAKSDLDTMKALTDAYNETAKEVADGKHKTPPAAVNALRKNVEKRLPPPPKPKGRLPVAVKKNPAPNER
jgi:hypothetical protein